MYSTVLYRMYRCDVLMMKKRVAAKLIRQEFQLWKLIYIQTYIHTCVHDAVSTHHHICIYIVSYILLFCPFIPTCNKAKPHYQHLGKLFLPFYHHNKLLQSMMFQICLKCLLFVLILLSVILKSWVISNLVCQRYVQVMGFCLVATDLNCQLLYYWTNLKIMKFC